MASQHATPPAGQPPAPVSAGAAGDLVDRRHLLLISQTLMDAADPGRIEEQFVVASWEEHLRQGERVSRRDQQRLDKIRAMTRPDQPPKVTHWVTPPAGQAGRAP